MTANRRILSPRLLLEIGLAVNPERIDADDIVLDRLVALRSLQFDREYPRTGPGLLADDLKALELLPGGPVLVEHFDLHFAERELRRLRLSVAPLAEGRFERLTGR